ncbi:hypothetical protein COO60DRAFT_748174 [Scenedesmus sp. NREL 46B-D3]|nr:hypothetical protein COO60DRAFT_748174 [Scenedesmus sp. NREL 46B-D3]
MYHSHIIHGMEQSKSAFFFHSLMISCSHIPQLTTCTVTIVGTPPWFNVHASAQLQLLQTLGPTAQRLNGATQGKCEQLHCCHTSSLAALHPCSRHSSVRRSSSTLPPCTSSSRASQHHNHGVHRPTSLGGAAPSAAVWHHHAGCAQSWSLAVGSAAGAAPPRRAHQHPCGWPSSH